MPRPPYYPVPNLIAPGIPLYNPKGLRRWRMALGDAIYAKVPIVVLGDSIAAGQGSDNVNVSNNIPDNTQGYVGQLRQLFATTYIDPGEGFIFNTDSRVATTGAQTGNNAFSGPERHSTRLLSGQTLSITIPTGVTTLTVLQGNNGADLTGTYTKNAGGSIGLNALSNTGVMSATDIAVVATDAIVISGPASAQTYIGGLVLSNAATGVQVHRIAQNGYDTGDALGGETSGVLNLTAPQQTLSIRKAYEWAGGPGLLIISFGVNDQQFQAGGGTTAQNGVTLALHKAWMQQIVNTAVADGWCCLILSEPSSPNAVTVAGGMEADYKLAQQNIAQTTDHVAFLDIAQLWGTPITGSNNGLQFVNAVHPKRKGHGDIARLLYAAIAQPLGEFAPPN